MTTWSIGSNPGARVRVLLGVLLGCSGACKDDDEPGEDGSSSSSGDAGTDAQTVGSPTGADSVTVGSTAASESTAGSDTQDLPPSNCNDGALVPGDVCFGPPIVISSTPTGALLLADFDGDAVLDLAAGHDDGVSISLGAGDGTFVDVDPLGAMSGVLGLAAADIDGDGPVDLVVAESGADTVAIYLGDGVGGFDLVDTISDPASFPRGLALGNFTGTAAVDLVVVAEQAGEVALLEGNGDGTFAPVEQIAAGIAPLSVAVAEIDGDGAQDLVVPLFGGDSVGVFWGEMGGFSDIYALATGAGPRAGVAGDFDDDGVVDLATSDQADGDVTVHTGLGNRTFAPGQSHPVGPGPRGATTHDVDDDGIPDIFVAIELSNSVGVLRSSAEGLAPVVLVPTLARPAALAVGDLDGDGAPDIVAGNPGADGGISVNLATP